MSSVVYNFILLHPDVKHDCLHLVLAIEDKVHHALLLDEMIIVEHVIILHHNDRPRAVLDDHETVYEIENELLVVVGRGQSTQLLCISAQ